MFWLFNRKERRDFSQSMQRIFYSYYPHKNKQQTEITNVYFTLRLAFFAFSLRALQLITLKT
jgi:hypothetical protein